MCPCCVFFSLFKHYKRRLSADMLAKEYWHKKVLNAGLPILFFFYILYFAHIFNVQLGELTTTEHSSIYQQCQIILQLTMWEGRAASEAYEAYVRFTQDQPCPLYTERRESLTKYV